MDEALLKRLLAVIKPYKEELETALRQKDHSPKPLISLKAELDCWFSSLKRYGVECTECVNGELAPVFNRNYHSENEMVGTIRHAFEKTVKPVKKLIELREDIKRLQSDDVAEQMVVNTVAMAIEKILLEWHRLLGSIEDILRNDPMCGAVDFEPDITTELRQIQNWYAVQNNAKSSNHLFALAAAFGLGYLFGGA